MTNKELVLKFYDEVFNAWDLSHLDDFMLDSYKQHSPEAEDGKEGFIKFAQGFFTVKPHMDIVKVLCEGDMVMVFFRCTMGTNGVVNKVFDLYRVEDGKLAEHWDCVMKISGMTTASGNSQF